MTGFAEAAAHVQAAIEALEHGGERMDLQRRQQAIWWAYHLRNDLKDLKLKAMTEEVLAAL